MSKFFLRSESRVTHMSSNGFPPKKPRPLIGRTDRSGQPIRGLFFGRKTFELICVRSQTKLTLKFPLSNLKKAWISKKNPVPYPPYHIQPWAIPCK